MSECGQRVLFLMGEWGGSDYREHLMGQLQPLDQRSQEIVQLNLKTAISGDGSPMANIE